MPTKLAVREMLPPKRLICAIRYSRSNISRASRSAQAGEGGAEHAAGARRRSRGGLERPAPRARSAPCSGPRISARSSVLRSWRTLPGQRMVCSCASASGASARSGRPWVRVQLLEEVPGELGDVLAPRLEARDADRHHVQPVEELGAEAPGLHLAGEVAGGGGDHPHVDPHRVGCRRRAGRPGRPARAGSSTGCPAACRRPRRRRGCRCGRARRGPGSTPRSGLSRPKSTSSICSAPIEAELTVTNGPLARSELRWR